MSEVKEWKGPQFYDFDHDTDPEILFSSNNYRIGGIIEEGYGNIIVKERNTGH